MATKTLRFNCELCKKTIALKLTDEFQEHFKKEADYWPYPMVYPHEGHWALIYLDKDFVERGVNSSKIVYKE